MPTCWASLLGDCGAEQSREHLISGGIWEGDSVEIVGLPWCKDTPKRVGLGSLTSKILCRSHNSRLSPLDTAAKAAFGSLRHATALGNERAKLRPRKWKVRRFEILGRRLERWFLKTAVNITVTHPGTLTWAVSGTSVGQPPEQFVRIAYGLVDFQSPMGLYAVGNLGEDVYMSDVLHFAPLLYTDAIIGALFVFRGFRFYLHLDSRPMPSTLELPSQPDARWARGSLLYHLKEMNFRIAKKRSHYVQFLWHIP